LLFGPFISSVTREMQLSKNKEEKDSEQIKKEKAKK